MNKEELYKKAIKKWGENAQIIKAVEECGELVVALAKNKSIDGTLDEMVDVEIMVEQLKLIFDYVLSGKSAFDRRKRWKLEKLENLLND